VRFLDDERLYWDADHCLRFLRALDVPDPGDLPTGDAFHMYWQGPLSAKHAFAIKSVLATQPGHGEVCLWLDAEHGYAGHEANQVLGSLAPRITVREFDPAAESRGTPVEDSPELQHHPSPSGRANLFRLVTLYKHGGVYIDLDTMLLRDLRELRAQPFMTDEYSYRWSAHLPYGNNAVLRFNRGSENALKLLERAVEVGTCTPQEILKFEGGEHIDLLILPCPFFDPLWPHFDGRSRLEDAPFDGWDGFFRRFGWRFRRRRDIDSYRDFFPGAFAYHWHNQWQAPEHEPSYFGMFDREFAAEVAASGRERRSPAATAG